MMTQIGVTTGGDKKTFHGYSTDVKPIDCGNGSEIYELDTGKAFVFNANNIDPVKAPKGWWAV